MLAKGQAFDVLEDEVLWLQLDGDSHKVIDKLVARVVKSPLPNQREALTRRTANNHVDVTVANTGAPAQFFASDVDDALADGGAVGKVEFVSCGVNRVDLDGGHDVETGLLEPQTQSPCPCK